MNYQEKLYNATKKIIIDKTKYDENSELLKKYKEYIYRSYDGIITNDKTYNFFLNYETNFWTQRDKNVIENYLHPDFAYNKLKNISRKVLNFGLDKWKNNTKVNDEIYENFKKTMEDYFEQVRPQNKLNAQILLSEGLLDLNYAHEDTNITSIRLGMSMIIKDK